MNAIDLIGNFILGGVIGGALYDRNMYMATYIAALLLSVGVLSIFNYLYRHYRPFYTATVGNPIPIIKNGKFLMEPILAHNSRVDLLNVASQLNLQGIFSFSEVAYAQIEPNGALTATCESKRIPAAAVIYQGEFRDSVLEAIDKTREDVLADMAKYGLDDVEDIFLGEHSTDGFVYVCMNGRVVPYLKPRADRENDKSKNDGINDDEKKRNKEENRRNKALLDKRNRKRSLHWPRTISRAPGSQQS
ncbi:membrane protein [Lasius niger]|uniref:Membrane protein n=1 Tax=Lasius niger TaxID=67767 RepID=A0A0J7KGT0_LASNI|nr:membrane protein [Lasius niger]